MELYVNPRVQFIENDELDIHSYLLDGDITLTGVTTLMRKHGLSPDYSGIDPEVLRMAARIGTAAHRAIEAYCDGKAVEETNLIKSFRKLGLNIVATEYLMSDNEIVASSMDLLAQVDSTTYDIIDIKRTDKVHKDALAWQLGFYKWLFLMANPWATVRNCYCLHVKKSRKKEEKDHIEFDTCEPLILIEPQPLEEILKVMECERNGKLYTPSATPLSKVLAPAEITALAQGLKKELLLSQQLEEASAAVKGLKELLYQWMLDNNADSIRSEDGSIEVKLKRPYTKTSIDSKRLKELYPDVANDCSSTSTVKGNVTIKINS